MWALEGWPALAARAPGADRCGARPVRQAAGTARAPTPPWPGGPNSGRRRPGAQRFPDRPTPRPAGPAPRLAQRHPRAVPARESRPAGTGALRAPLMFYVKKILTAAPGCAWLRHTIVVRSRHGTRQAARLAVP